MVDKNDMVPRSGKGVGLGVAAAIAAAAAAAGAYWFYGSPDAAQHRRQVKSFMLKARADVLSAVEKAKHLDRSSYYDIVEKVVSKYSSVAGITATEIAQMARDLRGAWDHMKNVGSAATELTSGEPSGTNNGGAAKAKKAPAKKRSSPKKKAA